MIKLGVLMDDIATIDRHKDTSLAFLFAALKRGWQINYFMQSDLFLLNNQVMAKLTSLTVDPEAEPWFQLQQTRTVPLTELDIVFMRKDPPFDMEYINSTYLLEKAAKQGVWVLNNPRALRDFNEKLLALEFPKLCPPTLVTRDMARILEFYQQQNDIVLKPLNSMGGRGIFRIQANDLNAKVITQMLTDNGKETVMAQKFIPEITNGDRRILIMHGKAVPYILNRIPASDDFRGNLVQGATGIVEPITDSDIKIAEHVAPFLLERDLLFVGIDIIGGYLTEVNITSPTALVVIEDATGLDLAGEFLDGVEAKFKS